MKSNLSLDALLVQKEDADESEATCFRNKSLGQWKVNQSIDNFYVDPEKRNVRIICKGYTWNIHHSIWS
jgi:hypothetical protein